MNRKLLTMIAGAVAVASVLVSPAGATISGIYWHDDEVVLAQGSNANVVGFWQVILCANSGPFTVDAVFGSNTKAATQSWQSFIGVTADGVVGSNTWITTEFAQYGGGQYRLTSSGNGMWGYYSGGGRGATYYYLPSNPFIGDQWLWQNSLDPDYVVTGAWYDTSSSSNSVSPSYNRCP